MDLILTTSQSVLLLDTDSGLARVLDSGRGLYYGIARHGDHLYVAARQRLVSSSVDPALERGEILRFDRQLRYCDSLQAPFPLRDLHEIAWHDGRLYCTASYDNMVAIYDGQQWEPWYPLGEKDVGDQNHFNSLMFEDGKIWILAHNRGDSELMAFSLTNRALLQRQTLGNCAHNIWREHGVLHTCSSAEGKLVGEDGFVLETGGFPRGVAFDATSRCIGVSSFVERKERDLSSGLLQVRGRDWRAGHEITLDGEGLVLDLMALPAGFALPPDSALRRLGRRLGWLPAAPATLQFGRRAPPA